MSGGRVSKPASEGEVEGGERDTRRGDVAAAAAVATVSPVSWLLLAWQAGGDTEQERSRRGDRETGWPELYFILAALLSSVRRRELQARSKGVDLGTGHRAGDLWITSSEYG